MLFNWLSGLRIRTKIQIILLFMVLMLGIFGALTGSYIDNLTRRSVEQMSMGSTMTRYNSEIIIHLDEIIYTLSFSAGAESFRRINLRKNFDRIDSYLNLQLMHTDDPELRELIANTRDDVDKLRSTITNYEGGEAIPLEAFMQISYISNLLREIQKVNERHTLEQIEQTIALANSVMLTLIILGLVCFVFALLTMIYFPDYIANPIRRLMESMEEITRKNYDQRLDVRTRDEFGQMAESFNHMAEKLNEYEDMNVTQLKLEKKRIETIIGEMREAIIGLDPDENILFANSTALRLAGIPEEKVVNRPLRDVARENKFIGDLEKEITSGRIGEGRMHPALTVHQNGKTYYYEKDLLPISTPSEGHGTNGQPVNEGTVIILKNITEFREQDLKKTNLMATVSHELKTPISAIDMSIGLLEDERIGKLNEEQEDLVGTIRQNSARLLKMVNEILDLSRIESGNISLELDMHHPEEVVRRALSSTSKQYHNKGVIIVSRIEDGLPEIQLDIQKTTSVMINFLTNALRYSEPGQEVRIRVEGAPDKIIFTVSDQGPGIAPDDQEKIFQRYSRARDDKTQGTGLGLSISKEFIEKQGGKIWLKSEVGAGSTFGFQLKV